MHRRHLLLMLVSAQVSHLGLMPKVNSSEVDLDEVVSDLTESMFCVMNGAYKAAYTLLRSAVENYLRVMAKGENPSILSLTSVYQLFDRAEEVQYFGTESGALCFKVLKSSYSNLCKFVHSAVKSSESSVDALSVFPIFDRMASERFRGYYEKVVVSMVDALVNAFPIIYLEMHFTGQDLLSDLLPRRTMRHVHGCLDLV